MTNKEKHELVRLYGNFTRERDRIIIETFKGEGYRLAAIVADPEVGIATLMVRPFHVKQKSHAASF